ncbi:rRNA-binding endoribonuclease [Giardia muris]|uniref:rRNA-binding endoribonuclease n=1 Tax=Giardia muris TaxID=5742 RepID=A0A4Z1T3W3_GIAMU|nr:rRNA-binding endoribonuclease [Giardia muris]|eukprot:TNJ27091.1 rRNA-binding endoribonuclease [Giardia muris]
MDGGEPLALSVVLDTNALLRRVPFWELAVSAYVTPGVLAEVKDDDSLLWLNNLPFPLKERAPSEASLTRVRHFAKATGDLLALSSQDIEALALTYELDVQAHGGEGHLRREPPTIKDESMRLFTRGKHAACTKPLYTHGDVKKYHNQAAKTGLRLGEVFSEKKKEEYEKYKQLLFSSDTEDMHPKTEPEIASKPEDDDPDEGWILCRNTEDDKQSDTNQDKHIPYTGGWVTLENLTQDAIERVENEDNRPLVALHTSDFSMQNTAMQMGLRVLSSGGIIKSIQRYAGKCSSCLHVTPAVNSEFCENCGNRSIMRVKMFVADDGKVTLSTGRKHFDLRGTIFQLPNVVSKHYLGKAGKRTIIPVASDRDPNAEYILRGVKRRPKATGEAHFAADLKGPDSSRDAGYILPYFLRKNPTAGNHGKKAYAHHM